KAPSHIKDSEPTNANNISKKSDQKAKGKKVLDKTAQKSNKKKKVESDDFKIEIEADDSGKKETSSDEKPLLPKPPISEKSNSSPKGNQAKKPN
ncbi:MAG: hypothetical protein AAF335_04670, partial [Bacteroidota bacterium]